ncbi:hypothetical protein MIND_01171000 [Mycena indigotica]|uniref:Thaumatin-like protein n=1 Tax=Mycena indigotica TaxID=2126181 RepID=A0A8H6VSU8_9AGAR|nr:uncharacterized protein MIND_01171000 [Mycena indigotica]KAF7292727.1 hypothetical protein MIND_01171000 [Mycena indigotica]
MKSLATLLAFVAVASADRVVTVYNACPFTIWWAWGEYHAYHFQVDLTKYSEMFTDPQSPGGPPNYVTGWEAAKYTAVTFNVPERWNGRIWGRRNCNFANGNTDPNTSCLDGGCNGGLRCALNGGTGVPPATVAEFNLHDAAGLDWYDVSLVDGYNLPMRISTDVGCPAPDCPVDLGPNCPTELKGPFDSVGFPVGCKTACTVDSLAGHNAHNPNCCTNEYNTPATCPPSGVRHYDYFKRNCPNSYAYAFDEGSGTALWTCASSRNAHYTITFCP